MEALLLSCVLVHLGCPNKIPQAGWLIDSRNLLFKVLEAEEFKIKVLTDSVSSDFWFTDFWLCPYMVEEARDLSLASIIRQWVT